MADGDFYLRRGVYLQQSGRGDIAEIGRAYKIAFRSPAGMLVLPDLAEYLGAMANMPDNPEPFVQGRAAGKRDAWLHIARHVHLTDEELVAVHLGKGILKERDFQR